MSEVIIKIAYISGARADFGLMSYTLKSLSKHFRLQIYSTGMHLMEKFGRTGEIIKKDFPDMQEIPVVFKGSTPSDMSRFVGNLIVSLTRKFERNRPDCVITLGDRPEMLSAATVCAYMRIATAQVHAGDRTFTVDEMARHAITKLSHIHFAATEKSASRLKKMGEENWRIHVVGAPSLDTITHEKLPSKKEVFEFLNLKLNQKYILVLFHPVSEAIEKSALYMKQAIDAVKSFELPIVVVYPNSDSGNTDMIKVIEKEKNNPRFRLFPNIEYQLFLSVARECAVWVGNSSAGMIESASLHVPVVNIGIRELGREHAENVLSIPNNKLEIKKAVLKCIKNEKFRQKLMLVQNPWGDGYTAEKMIRILKKVRINDKLLTKQITY